MGQTLLAVSGGPARGSVGPLALPSRASLVGRSESWPLLDGDRGTAQTIDLIRRAWRDSQVDPYVRATAGRILQGVPPHDDLAECRAIFRWVLRNIRFTKDPVDFETVSGAKWTLAHRMGDCDDINAVLLPALLSITGHPVRLVTIANHPAAPDVFSHIYAEVLINGRWIPVDAARTNPRFGSAPVRYSRKRIWSLTDARYEDVSGLSGNRVRGMGITWEELIGIAPPAALVPVVKPMPAPPTGGVVTPQPVAPGGVLVAQPYAPKPSSAVLACLAKAEKGCRTASWRRRHGLGFSMDSFMQIVDTVTGAAGTIIAGVRGQPQPLPVRGGAGTAVLRETPEGYEFGVSPALLAGAGALAFALLASRK
jgi:hypothetical protein